jgi:protein-tyrosine phosphatase
VEEMSSSNARDLGGLRTADGHSIRPGLVYRSDDTFWSGRAQPPALPPAIGTAIDLRRPMERSERGVPPFVGPATLELHESLVDESRTATIRSDEEFARFYTEIFDDQRERLGGIMRRLATDAPLPAVAYCAAGKDRTGVTIAVLARLLGVGRPEIVRDYVRSVEFMAWVLSTGQLEHERLEQTGVVLPAHSAHAQTMELFLDHLDAECGDEEGLAAAIGLERAHLADLRGRLLQPAGESVAPLTA